MNESFDPREKSSLRNILLTVLLSMSFFASFLFALEIILRPTHLFNARISWARPDPVLGWRNVPGSSFWHFSENDHPITGTFNNYGWKDKNWSLDVPENTARIALLGDSYIEGLQVEYEKSFQYLTERKLNSTHSMQVELLNFGQSGFTQTEEYLLLTTEVTRFSPHLVVLFFYPENDIADINKETAFSRLRPFYTLTDSSELVLDTSFNQTLSFKVRSFISPLKRKSVLVSLIAEKYNEYQQQRRIRFSKDRLTNLADKKINGVLSLATSNPDPVYVENYRLNKTIIKKMADFCSARGIRFLLVALNTKTYYMEEEKNYLAIDPSYNTNFFDDDLKDFARSLNIDFLGLQRVFHAQSARRNTRLQWGHWNYMGHQVVADSLTGKLESILY